MKIAYFLDTAQGLGGAGNLLLQQARIMSQLHEVIVVIPCNEEKVPNKEYERRCNQYGLNYYGIEYITAFTFYNVNLYKSLSYVERICHFLKENAIDLVHSVQLNVSLDMACRKLKIPNLMDIYQLSDSEFRLYIGDFYPSYHLCDSEKYSNKWSDQLGIESRCVRPVSPVRHFHIKKRQPGKEYVFLLLGRLCRRKNQLAAIRIFERIHKEYFIKLIIAGELVEDYAEECMEYVKEHDLGSLIEFRDFVSDIEPLMEESDCLLCCSYDESFPSSIVEAVSYDLSIITTPAGGISEVFTDRVNAFVSRNYSEDSMEKAVRDCLIAYETGEIEKIHSNAKRTWELYFSEDAIRKKIDKYYMDMIKHQKNRAIDYKTIEGSYAVLGKMVAQDDELIILKNRILYILKIYRCLKRGKAYIWGAGRFGKLTYNMLLAIRPDVSVTAFIDRIKRGQYCNLPVMSPDNIDFHNADSFFISYCGNTDETLNYLENKGYRKNVDIWFIN